MHDGSWNFISSDTLLKRTKNRVGQWWWCNVYWKTFRRFHFQPLAALSFPGSAFASGLKCRKKWSMWKIRFFPIQVYLSKRFFFSGHGFSSNYQHRIFPPRCKFKMHHSAKTEQVARKKTSQLDNFPSFTLGPIWWKARVWPANKKKTLCPSFINLKRSREKSSPCQFLIFANKTALQAVSTGRWKENPAPTEILAMLLLFKVADNEKIGKFVKI